MNKREIKDISIMTVFFIAFAVVLLIAAYLIISIKCWSNWGGTETEWRISRLSCQVKTETQGWIPDDRFRTFD